MRVFERIEDFKSFAKVQCGLIEWQACEVAPEIQGVSGVVATEASKDVLADVYRQTTISVSLGLLL